MAGEFGPQRWTGAVREAFLRGLAAHGGVRRACRENGVSTSGAYGVRARDPDFARLWDAAVARVQAARRARIQTAASKGRRRDGLFRDYRPRSDGWTEWRTRRFLRALAETGCVRDACVQARISDQSAYRMRRRDAKFAAAWEKALDESVPTLEQAAWERAVEGWDEIVWKDGVEVSRKRRYSDALLKFLLDRRDVSGLRVPGRNASRKELVAFAEAAAKAAGGFFGERADPEDTNRAILKKLEMIDRARAMEAAEDAEREAARTAGAGEADRDGTEDWEDEGTVAPPPPSPAVFPRITGCPGG